MVTGHYPKTLVEALKVRKSSMESLIIAGGTDAMVTKKTAADIIFLNNIEEIKKVQDKGDSIFIGSAATYSELIKNPAVPEILKNAMKQIAAPAIRNAGTLGGNICNASPAGDTLPVLYVLDADVVVACLCGDNADKCDDVCEKKIPVKDFILGIRKLALKNDEIVTGIEIKKSSFEGAAKVYYEKVGARKSQAISKLSFVGEYFLNDEKISDIRIAFGSVGVTALRFPEIENLMVGLTLPELKSKSKEIADKYMEKINPIDDQRSTAEYRKSVCKNLLLDFLTQ